jgi:predicted PurR-regulated permease PerM
MGPERVVTFRPRTILVVAGLIVAVVVVLWVVWTSHRVLSWVLISLFLAMAINPAVEWLLRHGIRRRGVAAGIAFAVLLALFAAIAAVFIPTLVNQVNDFVNAVPGYVHDLTKGRGPLGFLETKYHVVEKVQKAIRHNSSSKLAGGASAVLSITESILSFIAALVTIAFLTFFMVLEGPAWMERLYGLMSGEQEARWRAVARDVYRTVGGYVTGNLLISLIAGTATAVALLALGIPFALALALLVAILDLIPLAGATVAAVIVVLVALTQSSTDAIVMAVFFLVYQQLENHLLQPLVYGRTVQLSPLAVLVAVLVGAEVAGIMGALAAIPVAGTIQILLVDAYRVHRARREADLRGGEVVAPYALQEPEPAER